MKDPRAPKMVKLYKSGQTLEEVGLVFGVSRERIRQILVKENCQRRKTTGRKLKERGMKSCAKCRKIMRLLPSQMVRLYCSNACYLDKKRKYHTDNERLAATRGSVRNYMRRKRGTKPENFRIA